MLFYRPKLNETMKTVEQLKGKRLKPTSEVTATEKRTKRLPLNAPISSKLAFFKRSSCLIKYMYEIYYSLVVVILINYITVRNTYIRL